MLPERVSADHTPAVAAGADPARHAGKIYSVHDLTDFGIVNLNQFRLLRVVGKGAFGKVRIVEKKDTGLTFALKYIRKEEGMCFVSLNADFS